MTAEVATLRVGGLVPLTTIDFPGKLAAVVFLQGCPWRCGYCHNPGLQAPERTTRITWEEVQGFLRKRRGLLDAVVFSGGEPTLQAGLGDAIDAVRGMGFLVGLHTAGTYPERLAALLPRLDWVGLDVKAPWDDYDAVTGVAGSGAKVRTALAHVRASGVAHECRTTWHSGLFDVEALAELGEELARFGVKRWSVQRCHVEGRPHEAPPAAALARVQPKFAEFTVR